MLKAKGYRTGVFGKWHVGLTWLDKDGKRLGGGFKNSLFIDYEKSTPLVDGPNARGFDESFVTPNCPTTDPLYIYIENGMVPVPASQRHRRANLPNPGGKWRWDNDEGWMAPGYEFVKADLLFYDKTREFIVDHRKKHPETPFFAVFSTQICHASRPARPGVSRRDEGRRARRFRSRARCPRRTHARSHRRTENRRGDSGSLQRGQRPRDDARRVDARRPRSRPCGAAGAA